MVTEVRKSEASKAKVRAIWALKDKFMAKEEAAALRETLDAMGETAWLAWLLEERGWSRATAYRHLNPETLAKNAKGQAERRTSQRCDINTSDAQESVEAEDGGDDQEVGKRSKPARESVAFVMPVWGQAFESLLAATRQTPALALVKQYQKEFDQDGWGLDDGFVEKLEEVYQWLGILVVELRPLVVTCAVNLKPIEEN